MTRRSSHKLDILQHRFFRKQFCALKNYLEYISIGDYAQLDHTNASGVGWVLKLCGQLLIYGETSVGECLVTDNFIIIRIFFLLAILNLLGCESNINRDHICKINIFILDCLIFEYLFLNIGKKLIFLI